MNEENSINLMLPEILVPAIVFSSGVLIVYFIMKARTKERLAMIEKGMLMPPPVKSINTALKNGLLIVGLGLGFFIGMVVSLIFSFDKKTTYQIAFPLALILGGAGLILFYIIENKNRDKQ